MTIVQVISCHLNTSDWMLGHRKEMKVEVGEQTVQKNDCTA